MPPEDRSHPIGIWNTGVVEYAANCAITNGSKELARKFCRSSPCRYVPCAMCAKLANYESKRLGCACILLLHQSRYTVTIYSNNNSPFYGSAPETSGEMRRSRSTLKLEEAFTWMTPADEWTNARRTLGRMLPSWLDLTEAQHVWFSSRQTASESLDGYRQAISPWKMVPSDTQQYSRRYAMVLKTGESCRYLMRSGWLMVGAVKPFSTSSPMKNRHAEVSHNLA